MKENGSIRLDFGELGEVLGPDNPKLLKLLAHVQGRELGSRQVRELPTRQERDWMVRMANSVGLKGQPFIKPALAFLMWELLAVSGGEVPVGMSHLLQLCTHRWRRTGAGLDCVDLLRGSVGGSGPSRLEWGSVSVGYLIFKMFELSDTPCWIEPSLDLVSALHDTTLKVTDPDSIRLPLPAFGILLPPGAFAYQEQGMAVTLEALLVSEYEEYVVDLERTRRTLLLSSVGASMHPEEGPGWSFSVSDFAMTEHSIQEACDTIRGWEECVRDADRTHRSAYIVCGHPVLDSQFYAYLSLFLLNLLLYLSLPGADIIKRQGHAPAPERQRKRMKKREAARQFTDWERWVGGTLTSSYRVSKSWKAGEGGGRELAYSHVRKGAFVNQPHGPGRTLRKTAWRRPTIVRPDLPTKPMGHTYMAGKEE